jgi:hypothetical protein
MNDRLSSTSEDPLYDRHELRGMISKDNQMDIYKVWYMQLNEIGMKAIIQDIHGLFVSLHNIVLL